MITTWFAVVLETAGSITAAHAAWPARIATGLSSDHRMAAVAALGGLAVALAVIIGFTLPDVIASHDLI
jgi:hypothetical protein